MQEGAKEEDKEPADKEEAIASTASALEEEFDLKHGEFVRNMRLSFACTYASAQGLTIHDLLALHDTGHCHFKPRMLYVGVSRSTGSDKLIVY